MEQNEDEWALKQSQTTQLALQAELYRKQQAAAAAMVVKQKAQHTPGKEKANAAH